jgi:hypothetical protein
MIFLKDKNMLQLFGLRSLFDTIVMWEVTMGMQRKLWKRERQWHKFRMPNLIPMRMIVKVSKDETSIAVHFALLFDNCNAYYDVDSRVSSRASPELEFSTADDSTNIYFSGICFALCQSLFRSISKSSNCLFLNQNVSTYQGSIFSFLLCSHIGHNSQEECRRV